MPLKGKTGSIATPPLETAAPAALGSATSAATAAPLTPPITPAATAPAAAPKAAPAPAKRAAAPLTKDEYWNRREERDIRTGECIRLSGVLQALLGSVNYGQYCTTSDRAAYLAQVKADAKELKKFITEEA